MFNQTLYLSFNGSLFSSPFCLRSIVIVRKIPWWSLLVLKGSMLAALEESSAGSFTHQWLAIK